MIRWALFLMLLGILFMSLEISIPGFGLFGVFSIISFLASFFVVFFYIPYGLFVILIEIVLLGICFSLLFRLLKKRKVINKLVLTEKLNESDKLNPESFIDKIGITATALKPSGFVRFDRDTVEVYSLSGLINPNEKVKVVEVRNKKIFVEKI